MSGPQEPPPDAPPQKEGPAQREPDEPQNESKRADDSSIPQSGTSDNGEHDAARQKTPKDYHFKVSAFFVRNHVLSMQARFLWVVIRSYEGGGRPAFPSLQRLEEITGIHRQTIQKYLRELEKSGRLIRVKERTASGSFQSVRYQTVEHPQTKFSSMVKHPQTNFPTTVFSSTIVPSVHKEGGVDSARPSAPCRTQAGTATPQEKPLSRKRKWDDGL